ncbi:hypothetical protein C8J57DRAFT_1722213 [Mycena rebaudengoi]|nr:hypothetical protein C8J57DRAFT_1722213 [Mycena rebaudengoi]
MEMRCIPFYIQQLSSHIPSLPTYLFTRTQSVLPPLSPSFFPPHLCTLLCLPPPSFVFAAILAPFAFRHSLIHFTSISLPSDTYHRADIYSAIPALRLCPSFFVLHRAHTHLSSRPHASQPPGARASPFNIYTPLLLASFLPLLPSSLLSSVTPSPPTSALLFPSHYRRSPCSPTPRAGHASSAYIVLLPPFPSFSFIFTSLLLRPYLNSHLGPFSVLSLVHVSYQRPPPFVFVLIRFFLALLCV